MQIFEVVDCTATMVPRNVRGSAETQCLSAEPVIDTTDIRGAQVLHNESGSVRLEVYTTSKAGERLKETTARITAQHLQRHDDGKVGIVVDSTLVATPVVRGAVSDAIVIDGAFSWDEAVQIADSINGKRIASNP